VETGTTMQQFNHAVSQAAGVLKLVVGLALIIAVAAKALTMFGIRLPVSAPGAQELAYLCGAFWLVSR
jgi:hypothetical protein